MANVDPLTTHESTRQCGGSAGKEWDLTRAPYDKHHGCLCASVSPKAQALLIGHRSRLRLHNLVKCSCALEMLEEEWICWVICYLIGSLYRCGLFQLKDMAAENFFYVIDQVRYVKMFGNPLGLWLSIFSQITRNDDEVMFAKTFGEALGVLAYFKMNF